MSNVKTLTHWLKAFWRRFWIRAPRQLRFTRSGKIIIAVAFATGFAAINTGNNLLFLVWGLVLAAIVLSGLFSEMNIKKIMPELEYDSFGRAGQFLRFPIRLKNCSKRFLSFGIQTDFTLRAPSGRLQRVNGPFFLLLKPQTSARLFGKFRPIERGVYYLETLKISTGFPFGFFVKIRRITYSNKPFLLVGPGRCDVAQAVDALVRGQGESGTKRAGMGEDFFALRNFREGDDPRKINWRSSVRLGRQVVIEHEARDGQRIQIRFAFAGKKSSDEDDRVSQNTFEYGLQVLGSVAEEFIDRGVAVEVMVGLARSGEGNGDAHLQKVLRFLATLEMQQATALSPFFDPRIGVSLGIQGFTPTHIPVPVVLPNRIPTVDPTLIPSKRKRAA